MELKRAKIPCYTYTDYLLRQGNKKKRVYLLLHGFGQKAQDIYDLIAPLLPQDSTIIAPNGNFPQAKKIQDSYKMTFAWYFYDNSTKNYFIDYDLPATILQGLLKELRLDQLPLTIIGFSQGGYLAPFAAEKITTTDRVIGISCVFRYKFLKSNPSWRMDALHGKEDDIVEINNAKEAMTELKNLGVRGEFVEVEKASHSLDQNMLNELSKLLATA